MDGLNIASFTMKGSATVTPSTGSEQWGQGKNDVYLPSPHGKITIEGNLTPVGGTAARITPDRYETTRQVLDGDIAIGSNYTKFKVTPNGSEQWEIGSDGFLKRQ